MQQQIMSPTRAGHCGTTASVNNPTTPLVQASSCGEGFGLEAAGRASVGIDPSGTADPQLGVLQVSITSVGGNVLGQTGGDGVVVGISSTGKGEGFVTPRSQQCFPTIAEMVEGFPGAGIQLMESWRAF